jgi:hypothetical protein
MTDAPRSPIAAALAAAQAEITDPRREKSGTVRGRQNYKYAGLDDLLQAVRPVLSRHGLAVTQVITVLDGRLVLSSRLLHESGESIESVHPLAWEGSPQDHGSELSYARRYSLEALVGVAATDDDDASAATTTHRQMGHHPSWMDSKAWFCARLRDHGASYTQLADWCTEQGRSRPSEVDDETRNKMLDWVASPAGQAALGLTKGGGE